MNIDQFNTETKDLMQWDNAVVENYVGVKTGWCVGGFETSCVYKYADSIDNDPALNIFRILMGWQLDYIQPDSIAYAFDLLDNMDFNELYEFVYLHISQIIPFLLPFQNSNIIICENEDVYRKSRFISRTALCLTETRLILRNYTKLYGRDICMRMDQVELNLDGWPQKYNLYTIYRSNLQNPICELNLDILVLKELKQICAKHELVDIFETIVYLLHPYAIEQIEQDMVAQC